MGACHWPNPGDVLVAARARTVARAVPHWKLARRARSRGLPRLHPLPANPLLVPLRARDGHAPSLIRPTPTRPVARGKVRHVTAGSASSSRSHIELELEGRVVSKMEEVKPPPGRPQPDSGRRRRRRGREVLGESGGCWVVAGKVGAWLGGAGRRSGYQVSRPALCVETGAGGGRASEPSSGLLASLAGSLGCTNGPGRRGVAGRLRERSRPAGRAASDARPRAAWQASARAVGRRWGREGTSRHIRASEQAGGGHTDIDPQPRYEMAHWHAMAAAWLRRGESVGLEGRGRRRPSRECRKWPREACGLVLSVMFAPYAFLGLSDLSVENFMSCSVRCSTRLKTIFFPQKFTV